MYYNSDSDKNNNRNNKRKIYRFSNNRNSFDNRNRNRNQQNNNETKNETKNEQNNKDEDIPRIDIIRFIPPFGMIPPDDDPIEIEEEQVVEVEDFYNDDDYDEIIYRKIDTIDDLIYLGNLYNPDAPKKIKYNINVKKLYYLIEPLEQLKNMIGMEKVKNHIIDMIVYYLQDFEKYNKNIMHTVLYGPPGCGKTELAHILAKIYCKMGIIKKDFVHVVKRGDLIGEYLGHTARQTQKHIDKAKDGVLLIDEAYSLGNQELRDSFAKECIDTINQNLTENKTNFVCIIAGYKDALDKCFFAYNKGLERRFPFRFTVDNYSAEDIRLIYMKMVRDEDWEIVDPVKDCPLKFFNENREIFKFNGGDMETLFHMTRIAHARRVFCLPRNDKKKIVYEDIERALEIFINDESIKKRNNNSDIIPSMYI